MQGLIFVCVVFVMALFYQINSLAEENESLVRQIVLAERAMHSANQALVHQAALSRESDRLVAQMNDEIRMLEQERPHQIKEVLVYAKQSDCADSQLPAALVNRLQQRTRGDL